MEESAAETRGSDEALSVYPSLAMTGYLSISLIFYVEMIKISIFNMLDRFVTANIVVNSLLDHVLYWYALMVTKIVHVSYS